MNVGRLKVMAKLLSGQEPGIVGVAAPPGPSRGGAYSVEVVVAAGDVLPNVVKNTNEVIGHSEEVQRAAIVGDVPIQLLSVPE